MRVHGNSGGLYVSGRAAARIRGWTMTKEPGEWSVTAHLAWSDPYWLEKEPLELRLTLGREEWRYPGVEATWDEDEITVMGTDKAEVRVNG